MRTRNYCLPILLIVIFLFPHGLFAQEEPKKQLYLVWDYVVKPDMVEEFEDVVIKRITLYRKYKSLYPMSTYVTKNFHYYFTVPMESLADVEKMYSIVDKIAEEAGEKWQEANKGLTDTYEYRKRGFITLRPELCYIPENPRLQLEEQKFFHWGFCFIKPGKEAEFESIQKDWAKLFEENNISTGFNLYVGGIGTDQPFYFYAMNGKNFSDYWNQHYKDFQVLGESAGKLNSKGLQTLRKFEEKTGRYRPDLSYIIEK